MTSPRIVSIDDNGNPVFADPLPVPNAADLGPLGELSPPDDPDDE